MAKKATKSISEDGNEITFDFADGDVENLNVKITDLNEAIVEKLAMHGLSAKLGDSYAGVDTVGEAREKAFGVWEDLVAGNWTTRVAGAGGPRVTQLAEALVRVASGRGKELSLESAVEALGKMPDEQKKGLRKMGEIKKAISAIKIEKLQAEVTTDPTEDDTAALNSLLGTS